MVAAWAADTAAGRETLMLAYRRDNVDALNQTARRVVETAGLLSGPELVAPGGRRYRAGDRVITLAPGPKGAWVTSQPARVTGVDPDTLQLTAVTPDGVQLRMGADDISAERLGYSYAITAHRSQGSTVDVAHVLDDGGGRELAYVAMSRARTASHVYVTAGDQAEAVERLTWAWDQERRQPWITDRPVAVPAGQAAGKDLIARLSAERDRLIGLIPPDVTETLTQVRQQVARVESDRSDLYAGAGRWADTPVGHAYRHLRQAQRVHDRDVFQSRDRSVGMWGRRRARQGEQVSAVAVTRAETAWQNIIGSYDRELAARLSRLSGEAETLDAARQARIAFLAENPAVTARITEIETAIVQQHRKMRAEAARPTVASRKPAPRPGVRLDPREAHIAYQQAAATLNAAQIGGPAL